MPDHLFENDRLAGLYDLFSPSEQRGDFAFYLPSIMCASSVLDIGCGTGVLLGEARARGHEGRLVGIDPATGMINQARSLSDIEWIQGDLSTKQFAQEFDLIVMTGHAFQVLIEDSEIASTLELVATALSEKGRFAFETRNPLVRGWEKWDDEYSGQVIDDTGSVITAACEVEMPVEGELIRFSHTFTSQNWSRPETSWSILRFLDVDALTEFLSEAGLEIEEQFGGWDRTGFDISSPEIITIARRR